MDPTKVFCDNPHCPARGKLGEGNIKVHSHKKGNRCQFVLPSGDNMN